MEPAFNFGAQPGPRGAPTEGRPYKVAAINQISIAHYSSLLKFARLASAKATEANTSRNAPGGTSQIANPGSLS